MADDEDDTDFSGEIRVAARVIDYLSSGLYENAAACMKELINNSYDADATEVIVSAKPDADFIAIEDNGVGMTREQFEKHFSHVAESHKRDSGDRTALGRRKIGKIGIGFIAANELCDEMEIYSTCRGSKELLHVTIRFGEIRDRPFSDRRGQSGDVHKGDYSGSLEEADADESYTKVYLKRLRPSAREQFIKETGRLEEANSKTLYGLKLETVRHILASLASWDELDLYSQTRVRIGLNVPVPYLPGWTLPQHSKKLSQFTDRARETNFRVIYDGTELAKPTVLTDPRNINRLKILQYDSEHLTLRGYLFARHGVYKPSNLNGVLLRICESAVGGYDKDFLGFPKQIDALFQDWVTGEIYVDGDIDDALNIDRRTFRDTHPAFVELQTWFLRELRTFLRGVRAQMYTERNAQRQADRVEKERNTIIKVAERVEQAYGQEAGALVTSSWSRPAQSESKRDQKKLLKTFSVAEVYEIAIDVAEEVLPADLAERYISELTRRLRD